MKRPSRQIVAVLLLVGLVASTAYAELKPAEETTAAAFALPETDEGIAGSGPIRRYDWFKNLWSKRRQEFAVRAPDQKNAVVFLGDSITQGWGDDFRGDFGDLLVANRGISGDTTRGMLLRLQEDVLTLQPQAVVMLMGTNDLEENADASTIAENVGLILKQLHQHQEDLPIILCGVFPSHESKKRSAKDIQEINRQLALVVKGDDRVTMLDTWTLFADEQGNAKKEEFPDLLHPNEKGYAKWKAALLPVMATLGLVDTQSDPFETEPGYVSLFNGENLDGWCFRPSTEKMIKSRERWQARDPENAPAWPIVRQLTPLDGLMKSKDGRYRAIADRLVVATPPEGRKIQQLWTQQSFTGDFTLKLEFRATPNADSGIFLMGPQLQCRDFPLAGPYKDLKHYKEGDWNEIVVVARDGKAHCTCNGETIEEAFAVPASGPIGLEGDRGQIEYRRIRIRIDS
ncbi:MAG: GDSL-type esterase/lipase family protein [Rubripirellula sp.]